MAPPITSFGRTSVLAWSRSTSTSYLATGTVSGALDDSFSQESTLEIWDPFHHEANEPLEPIARVNAPARFNRIAWGALGQANRDRPLGVIAGGLENGTVALWDPSIALENDRHEYVSLPPHFPPLLLPN